MAAATYFDQVQKIYIAFYQRPADAAGLKYWAGEVDKAGGSLAAVINAFAGEKEAQDLYGPINASTIGTVIDKLYMALFGRAPDTAGKDFYIDAFTKGTFSAGAIALAVLEGAQSTDLPRINNKVAVANEFTAQVDGRALTDANFGTAPFNVTYSGESDAIAARGILNKVTADASTVLTAAQVTSELKTSGIADATDPINVGPGGTFTLTTAVEIFEGTTGGADTFTATSLTLQADDKIIDASSTDADVMNITLTGAMAGATTITKVETVNVNVDAFTGTATDVNATNITGATIKISSAKLGFNGVTGVTGAGTNTIVAGSGVTNLTVAGLTTGTVDTGSATTAAVTGTTVANKIKVNGNIALTNTASTLTTLDVSANANVTYDTTAVTNATTVTGAGNLALKMNGADVLAGTSLVKSGTGTISLQVTAGAAFDATNFAADKIIVGDVATVAATVASGAVLETNAALTSLTVITTTPAASTATVNANHDITTLDVSDAKLTTTVNANTGVVTIGTLTSAAGNTVKLAGSKNVTVSASTTGTVDATALTGKFAYAATTGTTQTVSGGTGANTVTTGATSILSYTGNTGVDTIDATALTTGTLAAALGGGDDIVKLNALGAAIVAVDGGAGVDTLQINSGGTTASATTFSISNIENISVRSTANSAVDTLTLAMAAGHLNGKTLSVSAEEAIDKVALTVTGATASNLIDLSAITLSAGSTTSIAATATTGATVQTIKGTNVADTITGATGLHVLTGGEGKDTFAFATATSTLALQTKISDFKALASTGSFDTLDIVNAAAFATPATTTDVSAAAGLAANKVTGAITNGVFKLAGLSADLAAFDTLKEVHDAAVLAVDLSATTAGAVAFEFGGNTYVLEGTNGSDAAADFAEDNFIELTGVTGITGVSAVAAAANVIFLA